MSKAGIAMMVLEKVLEWGGRLVRALRSGDDRRVDEVLRETPRLDEEWARYQIAKEREFGDDS